MSSFDIDELIFTAQVKKVASDIKTEFGRFHTIGDPNDCPVRDMEAFRALEHEFELSTVGLHQWEPYQESDSEMSDTMETVQEPISAPMSITPSLGLVAKKGAVEFYIEGLGKSSSQEDLLYIFRREALSLREKQMKIWMAKITGETGRKLSAVSNVAAHSEASPGPTGKYGCTFPGCSHSPDNRTLLEKHMHTHYPGSHFCPVCKTIFTGNDYTFVRHLKRTDIGKKCAARLREFNIDPSKKVRGPLNLRQGTKVCNFYYLGAMDDFQMPRDHFRMIAGKEREAYAT